MKNGRSRFEGGRFLVLDWDIIFTIIQKNLPCRFVLLLYLQSVIETQTEKAIVFVSLQGLCFDVENLNLKF